MENNLEQRMQKYAKQHKRKKIWAKILSGLSAVVVFCTTYALILPAITQEREVFCGKEEHIHSETCFGTEEKVLVCELSEEEAHLHSEECYENVVFCVTEENHVHSEECKDENGDIICGKEENHVHTDECYEEVFICALEEKEGHSHSDECYETKTAFCEAEEHSHNLSCYSDMTADIETEEQWKAGFASVELGEVASENLINIAKTQLGYHESTRNYTVLSDGETIKGRTRYGEWFGEPYSDWNTLFIGFCLEYSNADIPFDADIEKWIELLSAPEKNIYKSRAEHKALSGDIIFFDEDYDEKIDRAGIISEINENEYKVIIGDYGDSVQAVSFEITDESIAGFAAVAVPSPYVCGFEEHIHIERCFDLEGNLICGFNEHAHTESCLEVKQEESAGDTEKEPICGFEEHSHSEECFDESGNSVCETTEHTHTEACFEEKQEEAAEEDKEEYFCGFEEHSHTEECFDENENLVCETTEHAHTDECKVSFENLPEEEKLRIEQVISMIEALPTADEIDAKIMEFEEAEDYEGEEAWLTEIYQEVGMAYKYYTDLPENHRKFVTNSEKLMELEHIWSMALLIEVEIGKTLDYSEEIFSNYNQFIIYTESEGRYYAISGSGSAVEVSVTSDGVIAARVSEKEELLWTFTGSEGRYAIRNVSSGRYLYPFSNNGGGVTASGENRSIIEETESGIKIRSEDLLYAKLDSGSFKQTENSSEAAEFKFGAYSTGKEVYIWLDGTCGGVNAYYGSDNTGYTAIEGGKFILPDEWKTPSRYHYRVQGWYDIVNKKYYLPGAEVVAEGNTVFYPDWVPYSYDIGQYNAQASNTVSTNQFITTKVFDFTPLYNANFSSVNVTVSATGHSETWTLSDKTQFVFRDNSTGKLSAPNGSTDRNTPNVYTNSDPNQGYWSDENVGEKIFGTGNGFDPATGTGTLGKNYLGTGDFLFQYCNDPNNKEYYGYYYYDSDYHAASYNRSAQRFYVYNYLSSAEGGGAASFLPLNSPYVNTNGRTVGTYSDNGEYNQYVGTTHYVYNGGDGVSSEYWFAIQSDINFFLSDKPGNLDSEGKTANRGVNGEELVFNFTGDDDVWVFVDGKLVLDIGGIHQAVDGHINFSTGEVVVDGVQQKEDVKYLEGGDHVLTICYLERGAGGSNCKIKFNISSRYGLRLLKEDVLTREMLNGAEFTVYTDMACTKKAELWTSKEAYEAKEASRSAFTVTNGEASFWGLAAGNTYYIRETKFPTNGNYGTANGIIVVKLDNEGTATFDVIAEADSEESGISAGFTVHGFKIDVENHAAYLIATNSKEDYGSETTSVTVKKKWVDETPVDHSKDSVTVYILANGFRIQETTLSANNNWTYTWKNLPLNGENKQPVKYTVEEGTVPGYVGTVSELTDTEMETTKTVWGTVDAPQDGKVHLIKASNGYLAAGSSGLYWISSEETAKASSEARWVIKKDGTRWNFENEAGYILYYNSSSNARSFRAAQTVPSRNANDDLEFNNKRIRRSNYYFGSISDGNASASNRSNSAISFTLYTETTTTSTETVKIDGIGYLITNTKVDEKETVSIRINKEWVTTNAAGSDYLYYKVNFKLFEGEKDTGMSKEVTLQNHWTAVFENLPKYDSEGEEIKYVIKEEFFADGWSTEYGEMIETGENSYEITVTNICHLNYMLPSTGGRGNIISIVGGILVLGAGSAVIYRQIHKRRRKEEDSS